MSERPKLRATESGSLETEDGDLYALILEPPGTQPDIAGLARCWNYHPELVEALVGWFSAYDGFSPQEIARRTDPYTYRLAMRTRALLTRIREERDPS